MARKRESKRAKRPSGVLDEGDLAAERELYEASKEFLESPDYERHLRDFPPHLRELTQALERAMLETVPGSPAPWYEKVAAGMQVGRLAEQFIREKGRLKGRTAPRIGKDDEDRVLILEAQKIVDAHPHWGLQAVAREVAPKDPRGRAPKTIYQSVLLPAESRGELKPP